MTDKTKAAITVANKLTDYAKISSIQLCNYSKRFLFGKGTKFVADGHCIRAVGTKQCFIIGTFKAYLA